MKPSDLSQIERIFYPGWLMASQLRGGQEVRDGERLYRQARRLVEEARTALADAGYSETQRDQSTDDVLASCGPTGPPAT